MTDHHRPNVVILYADDLGWGDLGCFGADDIPTPHLDALCAGGVKLSQWSANSPVCSPSRASLLTGKYPAHAGVESILGGRRDTVGLPHQSTLASHLRERGYATGLFGKWHLGVDPAYAPSRYGFDEVFGLRAGCVDYYSHIFYWGRDNPVHDLWDGDDEVWLNGEYLTTVIGRRAADFITRHASRADPFLCYVPFNAPHYPLHAPDGAHGSCGASAAGASGAGRRDRGDGRRDRRDPHRAGRVRGPREHPGGVLLGQRPLPREPQLAGRRGDLLHRRLAPGACAGRRAPCSRAGSACRASPRGRAISRRGRSSTSRA